MVRVTDIVAQKIRLMDEQIKFLEYVWLLCPTDYKDQAVNNYKGKVPDKYKGC